MRESGGWMGVVVLSLAVAGPAVFPGRVAAQRAELLPQVGLFTALGGMGTALTETKATTLELGKRKRGIAYGLAVQFGGTMPLGVRGTVLFGRGSDIPVEGLGCEEGCTLENNIRVLTGAVVFHPLPALVLLRPYLLAGGGWKRFGFNDIDLDNLGLEGSVREQTRTAWQIGAGIELGLGLSAIVIELSDFISGFEVEAEMGEGRTQHDLFLTLGLRL